MLLTVPRGNGKRTRREKGGLVPNCLSKPTRVEGVTSKFFLSILGKLRKKRGGEGEREGKMGASLLPFLVSAQGNASKRKGERKGPRRAVPSGRARREDE